MTIRWHLSKLVVTEPTVAWREVTHAQRATVISKRNLTNPKSISTETGEGYATRHPLPEPSAVPTKRC